ncbi:MAG: HIRAN domain-containing protein [Clostridia bacterium]|nr:HIRAN domain-containing protein [Clostridia bacterium]
MNEFEIAKVELRGTSSMENVNEICEETAVGERIVFCPEPDNPFDSNAVAVKKENGVLLGYIPRTEAPFVCMLLKSNQKIFGRVSKVNTKRKTVTVTITGERLY